MKSESQIHIRKIKAPRRKPKQKEKPKTLPSNPETLNLASNRFDDAYFDFINSMYGKLATTILWARLQFLMDTHIQRIEITI